MATKAMIDEFMGLKNLVLIRGSRSAKVQGFSIDQELAKRGFVTTVVYLDEEGFVNSLKETAEPFEWAIIATQPKDCLKAAQALIDAKVTRVWMQEGSDSEEAVKLCEDNSISLVHRECVMMFADPVKSFHAFHRFIWKVLGKLPK